MLNIGKGPAVWSPMPNVTRESLFWEWRTILDHTDNLDIWDQADMLVQQGGVGEPSGGSRSSTIITAGTFLGLMHVKKDIEGGRWCWNLL